jgi:hypothetical protein
MDIDSSTTYKIMTGARQENCKSIVRQRGSDLRSSDLAEVFHLLKMILSEWGQNLLGLTSSDFSYKNMDSPL